MNKHEPKPIRKMKVVRAWLPIPGVFKFFTLYNDGTVEDAVKRDAEQYAKAYDVKIETVVGEPKEGEWNTIGS